MPATAAGITRITIMVTIKVMFALHVIFLQVWFLRFWICSLLSISSTSDGYALTWRRDREVEVSGGGGGAFELGYERFEASLSWFTISWVPWTVGWRLQTVIRPSVPDHPWCSRPFSSARSSSTGRRSGFWRSWSSKYILALITMHVVLEVRS